MPSLEPDNLPHDIPNISSATSTTPKSQSFIATLYTSILEIYSNSLASTLPLRSCPYTFREPNTHTPSRKSGVSLYI